MAAFFPALFRQKTLLSISSFLTNSFLHIFDGLCNIILVVYLQLSCLFIDSEFNILMLKWLTLKIYCYICLLLSSFCKCLCVRILVKNTPRGKHQSFVLIFQNALILCEQIIKLSLFS